MSAVTIEGVPVEELTEDEMAEARRYSLLVQWSPEDGKWIATAPELGGIATHGASPTEAVEMGADATDIGKTIHPHPTLSESVGMAAEAFEGVCTDLPPQRKK